MTWTFPLTRQSENTTVQIRTSLDPARPSKQTSLPDFIAPSVAEIDFPFLYRMGIRGCFIDLDGTIVERGKHEIGDELSQILADQPLTVFLATNRPKGRSLQDLKERTHAQHVIHPASVRGKPFKAYYRAALRQVELEPAQAVMVGDRYLQDVVGANRAGLYTVMVHKFGRAEAFDDKLQSRVDAFFLRRFAGRYEDIRRE
jgi:HAD superfamily phosphatase (TIGR01668 family)